jgi:hypothetical protein
MNDRYGEQNTAVQGSLAVSYRDQLCENLCEVCQNLFTAEGVYAKLLSKKGIVVHRPRLAVESTAHYGCWLCRRITEFRDVSQGAENDTNDLLGRSITQNPGGASHSKFLSLLDRRGPIITTVFRHNPASPYVIQCTKSQWWHWSKEIPFQVFTDRGM